MRAGAWTRRWVLALLPASLAAFRLTPRDARADTIAPRPRPGEPVFENGVFEDDVFD